MGITCPLCGVDVKIFDNLLYHQIKFHWKRIFKGQEKSTKKIMTGEK